MANELTTAEKIDIIDQHIRNLEYGKYNLELSLIEENAASHPDATSVSSLEAQIEDATAKVSALISQRDTLV